MKKSYNTIHRIVTLLTLSAVVLSLTPTTFASSRTTPFSVGETTDPGLDAQPCGPTDTNCFPSLNALQPVGTTTGSGGIMKFLELLTNGINYIGFRAPDAITTNTIWTLPSGDGLANTVLTTDGAGTLSWTNPGASGVTTAGYFTATSTTATSSFAGGFTVGTNKFLVDLSTGNVGVGTTSPYAKLSVAGEIVGSYFTATSTTATSTFGGGIQVKALNVTSTTATSTFANGINLSSGCFAVSGTCVTNSLGTNIITLGVGGQVQTLAAAIAARNAISHVSIAGPYNASITGTVGGTVDKRYLVADSGTPLSAILGIKGDVGVRINGAGNPIIRANVINNTTLELQAPVPKDFNSVSVEVFDIVPVAIVLLPETHIRYDISVSGSLTIPAFTTITALVPHTATIEMIGGSGFMFDSSNTQNEIFFKDLNLVVSKKAINRIFWHLPSVDGVDNLQWMTTFGLYNCRVNSLAEDFVYFNSAGPAFYAKGNNVRGTYDVFRMAEHRKVVFTDNDIETVSKGQVADQGEPTPIVMGGLGTYVYPKQEYFISGNRLSSIAGALSGDTQGHAAAFEIRNQLSNNARVIISNNHLSAVVTGGSDPDGSIGVKVGNAAVGGTQNPYIEISNNDLYVTNAGTGPVALYDGRGIGYTLTVKNNTVLPGSTNLTGQNVDKSITLGGALTVYGVGTSSPSGNVGVGTTSPYARLSVVGSVVADSFNATSSVGYQQGGVTLLTASPTGFNTFLGLGVGSLITSGNSDTFIGYQVGQSNTTGNQNTGVGYKALFLNATGNWNTATGYNALSSNTGGTHNSAYGNQALLLSTGLHNSAFGYGSLRANTTGNDNTSIGYNSGIANIVGSANTFLGVNAGNTDGTIATLDGLSNATAIGYNAQVRQSNSLILGGTGAYGVNVGIGTTSPYAKLSVVGNVVADSFNATSSVGYQLGGTTLLTGSSTLANTFVGFGSGTSTTTGGVNTFIGYQSGQANTTGYANTANGVSSLFSNTTGYNNTALGALSLLSNTSGWNNSAIGYQALVANTSGYGNVAIGYIAQATNTTGFQNTSVGNNSLNLNTTGYQNTGMGISALGANTTGTLSAAVGVDAGFSNTTGNFNTFLGSNTGYTDGVVTTPGNLTNATAIGYNAQVTQSNSLILGGTGAYGVNVGIGTTSPYAKLSVVGQVAAEYFTATSTTATSTFAGALKFATNTTAAGADMMLMGGQRFIHNYTISGTKNFFAGNLAGNLTQTGGVFGGNVGVGTQALTVLTSGGYNTAIGTQALLSNTSGSWNTAIGTGALVSNTNGASNTGIGMNVLSSNISGGNNVALGSNSGATIDTGSNNTFVGTGADGLVGNLTNATAIGYNAWVGTSSSLVLGGTGAYAVNVGIGTTSPYAKLSIHANNGETNAQLFSIASSTAATTATLFSVLNSGNVIIGNTSAGGVIGGAAKTGKLLVDTDTGQSSSVDIALRRSENTTATLGTQLYTARQRGTTASPLAIQNGDSIFDLYGVGYDGTDYAYAADIAYAVDGTVGSNIMPGRIMFSTSPAGSQTPIERMRIDAAGNVGIGTSSPVARLDLVKDFSSNIASSNYGARFGVTHMFGLFAGTDNVYGIQASTTRGNAFTTGTVNTYGGDFAATGDSNGTATVYGVNARASGGDTAYGVRSLLNGTVAPIGTGYGVRVASATSGAGISSAYGLYIDNFSAATSNYGVYVGDQGAGTNKFALYAAGTTDKSYFGGSVGIGTTSPYAALSVAGQVVADSFNATSTTATSTFANHISIGSAASYRIGGVPVLSYNSGSGSTNVGSNTNSSSGVTVGTGNTSSNALSSAVGYSNTASGLLSSAFGGGNSATSTFDVALGYVNKAGGGSSAAIGLNNNAWASGAIAIGASITNNTANSLMIGPSDTAKLTILSSGSVGIGTTSPYAKLSVVGGVVADSFNATSSVGYQQSGTTLLTSSSGIASTFLGFGTGTSTISGGGYNDTFLGYQVGQANTTGYGNTTVGAYSFFSNTTGYNNSALGVNTLNVNTTGYGNTAFGAGALLANTTGYQNTGLGNFSLTTNTTGYQNLGVGVSALRSNTVGYLNIGIGSQAIYSNDSGYQNIGIGGTVLFNNISGYANVGIGQAALWSNSTGDSNTAIGNYALYANAGASSTAVGYQAGRANTTGYANTFIGLNAGYTDGTIASLSNLTNATAIGYNAQVRQSNSFVLGGTGAYAVNVGIGTTSPSAMLHIGSAATGGNVRVANGWLCVDNNDTCTGATTAGTIYSVAALVTGVDLAENYQAAEEGLTPGDIVSLSGINVATTSQESFGVKRGVGGETIIGIVSTKPGFLLGNTQGQVPVALAGRVPVKVNLEHGPIVRGDRLAISETPGVGTKATATSSTIVATALEDFTSADNTATGTILAFVNLEHNEAGLQLEHLVSLTSTSTDAESDSFVSRFFERMRTWFADTANGIGDFVANRVHTKTLCVGDNVEGETCITKSELDHLMQNQVAGVGSANADATPVVTITATTSDTTTASSTDTAATTTPAN